MNILITGGLGYIGGRLAQYLSKDKTNNIILGTRKKINPPIWLPDSQIQNINWNELKKSELNLKNIDVVIHCAGMNAKDCNNDPKAAFRFNSKSTRELVQLSIFSNVKRFIYISTAHVYSSSLEGRIDENCSGLLVFQAGPLSDELGL